jgi:hypothetical protein
MYIFVAIFQLITIPMETKDLHDSVQDEQFNSPSGEIENTGTSSTADNAGSLETSDNDTTPASEETTLPPGTGVEAPDEKPAKKEELKEEEKELVSESKSTTDELESIEVHEEEEENEDPNNLDETGEVGEQHENYSILSREDLVKTLAHLLEVMDVEKVKGHADSLKVNFYKKNKAEVERRRKQFVDEGGNIEEFVSEEDTLELKFKELLKVYKEKRASYNEKADAEKVQNLEKKNKIIEELKELINAKESIGQTYQEFRDLQDRWRNIGVVPQQNSKDLWDTYHHHVELFYDYIKINQELKDLDLKKNHEAKIELCEKAEELLLEPSVVKAFNQLQKYHLQWREIGPVPKESRTDLWERFKEATSKINKQHQEYFENLKSNQKKNLESKSLLCEKAEEINGRVIDSFKDWEKQSDEIVELQKIWKTIGFAPKKDNNKIYQRFREACDSFFTRKREFYSQSKDTQNNNLQLKTDLCIQAEALKDSTEWKSTTEDFIQMQKKWKEIGPVPRKHSDTIWKRFRAACDHFFNAKTAHFSGVDNRYEDNLKLKLDLIQEIEGFVAGANTDDNFQALKDFQRRWSDIGFVPLKQKDEVQKKYRDTINKHFDNLKIDASKREIIKYKNKVDTMANSPRGNRRIQTDRDKYLHRLKQLESDVVLWENNIGFFAKSKNAESMIAEVQRKIESAKSEVKMLEEKIRLIDSVDE